MADSFAALFAVMPTDRAAEMDLLPYVEDIVRTWASHDGITPPEANGRAVSETGDEYEITAEHCDEGEYWRLRWTRPDADGRPLAWVSDVRLARAANAHEVEVSIQVRIVETGSAPPERISIGTPRLVSLLASDRHLSARVDGRQLSGPRFVDTEAAEGFVEQEVLAPGRQLPIIAISPRAETNQPHVTPYQMNRFLGLAEPWFIRTTSATRLISDLLGPEFSCYNGAIRVWWPGINPDDDDPRSHPLWLPYQVGDAPGRVLDALYNLLTRVSERRVADGGPTWRAILHATTQAREERLRSALADAELVGEVAEIENQLRMANAEVGDLRSQNGTLRQEIERLNEANATLEARLADAYRITSQLAKAEQPLTQPDIKTIADAVLEADGRFPHLRFTDKSYRSVERSLFQRPEEVFRAFQTLDAVGAEMADNNGDIGESLFDRLKLSGLDYRPHETDQTMSNWGAERRASYDGRAYEMERHLAWGGPNRKAQEHIRVYFEWEPSGGYWVIGHVGNHPTNTKT